MRALLRADWLRLRRRKDLWIIAIAVCVIGLISFLNAYHQDSSDPTWLITDPAQIRQDILNYADFGGMTEAEKTAQIDQMVADQLAMNRQQLDEWEAQQLVSLQKYSFPQSIFTVVGSGIITLVALVLIACLAVGDEFRYGTIRTSLLAAGERRRFLGARLISLLAVTVGLFVAQVLLGTLLGLVLGLAGADLGAVPPAAIDAASGLVWLGAQILIAMVAIALATALTVLLRSGALPLLLILVGALVELFVAHLPVFAPSELLSGVPQAFLTQNVLLLSAVVGLDTHALALSEAGQLPYQAFEIPMLGVAAVVAAWGAVFLALADRRLETMDVVE